MAARTCPFLAEARAFPSWLSSAGCYFRCWLLRRAGCCPGDCSCCCTRHQQIGSAQCVSHLTARHFAAVQSPQGRPPPACPPPQPQLRMLTGMGPCVSSSTQAVVVGQGPRGAGSRVLASTPVCAPPHWPPHDQLTVGWQTQAGRGPSPALPLPLNLTLRCHPVTGGGAGPARRCCG